MNIGKKLVFILVSVCVLITFAAYPQARLLSKVGFVDLDRIHFEYAARYLDGEISRREKSPEEHQREHRETVASLRRDKEHLARTGELRSDRVSEIVENDILINAVRKTAEVEGFSIVLERSSNFVYGSPEVDLTDRVLARLLRGMSGAADEE